MATAGKDPDPGPAAPAPVAAKPGDRKFYRPENAPNRNRNVPEPAFASKGTAAAAVGASLLSKLPAGGDLLKGGFYLSLAALVFFLILLAIHYTAYPIFAFSPNDAGIITIPTVSDRESYFTDKPAAAATVCVSKAETCNYTIAMDVFLTETMVNNFNPRVLLYRAARPIQMAGSDTVERLATKFPDTNLLVWIDGHLNDLYVASVTNPDAGLPALTPSSREPIKNIPIRKPFRLAIAFSNSFMEVYINGKLERSYVLKTPIRPLPTSRPNFYAVADGGSPGDVKNNVKIGSLYIWPRMLSASEIASTSSAPVDEGMFVSSL
jgi:hypothetical protein